MGKSIFNVLLLFSRIFVGSLFIVSGMIKANDPTGFSYKMEEYFSEGALGWTFFEPYALPIAVLICVSEIVLGFAVLFGGKPKLTAWLLMAMILFFLGLTYYTATCDPKATYTVIENGQEVKKMVQCVTDCGCFGDALKGTIGRSLTPWESFYKDVILFVFVLIILIGAYVFGAKRKRVSAYDTSATKQKFVFALNTPRQDAIILVGSLLSLLLFAGYFFGWMFPVYFSLVCFVIYLLLKNRSPKVLGPDWTIAIAMTIASTAFSMYCIMYLPVKDFTAYAVGNNLRTKMNDGVAAVYKNTFIYTNIKTGEDKSFDVMDASNTEWQNDSIWKFKDRKDELIKEGKIASISSFNPERDYELLTEKERQDPAIAAIVQKEINNYYQRYMAIEGEGLGYIDTIDPADYDTVTYPTSQFKIRGQGEKLLDPSKHMMVNFQEYILQAPSIIIITMLHTDHAYLGSIDRLKQICKEATVAGIPVVVITASAEKERTEFEKTHKLGVPYLVMDETEVKIMVRSNPGVMILKKAVVAAKWSGRGVPEWATLKEKL